MKTRTLVSIGAIALLAVGAQATACGGDTAATDAGPDGNAGDTGAPDVSKDSTTIDSGNDANTDAADAGCPVGFEDLDKNTTNGCETKTPAGITPTALKLWLRADRGLTCASSAVTAWADQSGNSDNAAPVSGHTGPSCGSQTLNGYGVPVFSPVSPDGGLDASLAALEDGVLKVDLGFLVGTPYTVFAVEQRSTATPLHQYFIGSGVVLNYGCGADAGTDKALHVGYRNSGEFTFAQFCDDNAVVLGADAGLGVSVDSVRNAAGDAGVHIELDGAAQIAVNTSPTAFLASSIEGRIGRGYETTTFFDDTRYHGVIAEIIVYVGVMTDADRAAVTAYLKAHWAL